MFYFLALLTTLSVFGKDLDWQGHRGARGLYPENTIRGMKEALKYPITTLELDVVISKDKQVIVSHEPWMSNEICLDPAGKELEDKKINLYQLTYKEIRQYDCGSKVHPRFIEQIKKAESKPLLKDLLRKMEAEMKSLPKPKNYSIEIKSTLEEEKSAHQPSYQEFTDLVMTVVQRELPKQRYMIQSFDWRVLKYLHEKYPDVRLVALRETVYEPAEVLKELGFSPAVFAPDWTMLKKSHVEFFHGQKINVIPWTPNTVKDIQSLIDLGVDGIITDYPNLIGSALGKDKLICGDGFNLFEGRCVKVPVHGLPTDKNPGWVCKDSYVQRRNSCTKLKVPEHATMSADGKTWLCNPGYKQYRSRCQKE